MLLSPVQYIWREVREPADECGPRPQLQVGIVRPLRPHARSADSMLRDPKCLCFRIFCSLTRKLRGRRVEGRAKIARRFARVSVAPDAIIQIEVSAGHQGFVGPRQWVLGFWSGASNRSMDNGVQPARHPN